MHQQGLDFRISSNKVEVRTAEHTQSREALNHLAKTIAAGGSGPDFFQLSTLSSGASDFQNFISGLGHGLDKSGQLSICKAGRLSIYRVCYISPLLLQLGESSSALHNHFYFFRDLSTIHLPPTRTLVWFQRKVKWGWRLAKAFFAEPS